LDFGGQEGISHPTRNKFIQFSSWHQTAYEVIRVFIKPKSVNIFQGQPMTQWENMQKMSPNIFPPSLLFKKITTAHS